MSQTWFSRPIISVQNCDPLQLINERIPYRARTRTLFNMLETESQKQNKDLQVYRNHFLKQLQLACSDFDTNGALMTKFLDLWRILRNTRSVAFAPSQDVSSLDTLISQVEEKRSDRDHPSTTSSISFGHLNEIHKRPPINTCIVHPLHVAVLAYHMGGPINAANTNCASQCRFAQEPEDHHRIHFEGDLGAGLDVYRITLVWYAKDGKVCETSGEHHLFLSGEAIPRKLVSIPASQDGEKESGGSMTIIFDASTMALYYESLDPAVIRNSVTLDFHKNVISDDDLHLLGITDQGYEDLEKLTLSSLVSAFPVKNYACHFHRLLFSKYSIQEICTQLNKLSIPSIKDVSITPHPSFKTQYAIWRSENWARMREKRDRDMSLRPPCNFIELLNSKTGRISDFAEYLTIMSLHCIHHSLGIDLCPRNVVEAQRELARKFIRDLSDNFVQETLRMFMPIVNAAPFSASGDLLSTFELHKLATRISEVCTILTATGFITTNRSQPHLLYSMASLSKSLGNAIDGSKEFSASPSCPVDGEDLEIFNTRCLYLFWCANWLTRYLSTPVKGKHMVQTVTNVDMERLRREIKNYSNALIRNWTAWVLFCDQIARERLFRR